MADLVTPHGHSVLDAARAIILAASPSAVSLPSKMLLLALATEDALAVVEDMMRVDYRNPHADKAEYKSKRQTRECHASN